jgi:hypothetical protein
MANIKNKFMLVGYCYELLCFPLSNISIRAHFPEQNAQALYNLPFLLKPEFSTN